MQTTRPLSYQYPYHIVTRTETGMLITVSVPYALHFGPFTSRNKVQESAKAHLSKYALEQGQFKSIQT